jgi:nucleotide-binding universal stress UspA family protein
LTPIIIRALLGPSQEAVMTPARILAPLTGGTRDATVLASAFAAAKLFDAHVVALFVRPDPAEAMPFFGDGVSGAVAQEIIDAAKEAADTASITARAALVDAARAADADIVDTPAPASASWREVQGNFTDQVVRASLLSDLVVFGPLSERDKPGLSEAFEAALLETGRPVLLTAQAPAKNLARRVVIGWNGSKCCARSVIEALPYLEKAETVEILTIGSELADADLGEYLRLHNIAAQQRIVDPANRAVGEALLEAAAASGASMLVLGGYGHTRLRELFAGGVTRHVVSHADIPLFLVH